MNRLWNWIWSLFTLAVVVGISIGTIWGYEYVSTAFKKPLMEKKRPPSPVQTMKVTRMDLENKVVFNASVNPDFAVSIYPKVSGRLQRLELDNGVPVVPGVKVKKGDLIATLDDDMYLADVLHAKSLVNCAKVAVDLAKVNIIEAERERDRQEKLLSSSAGRPQDYDMAVTSYERAEAQLKQALANVAQAEAVLAQRQVSLDETRIYSPHDGVISNKFHHIGTYLTPTIPLVEVMNLDTTVVIIMPPQQYMSKIALHKTVVRMSSDNWKGTREGIITRIYPGLDPVTRAGRVESHVTNEKEGESLAYRPGMYLSAAILMGKRSNVVAIPMGLIIRDIDRYLVFKVEGDIVRATNLELGIKDGEMVEVISGLSEGDEIVCNGQYRVTDGAKIKCVNEQKNSESL